MTAAGAIIWISVLGFGVRSLACVAVVLWVLPLASLARWLVGLALVATAMMVFAAHSVAQTFAPPATATGLALVTMAVREVALGGVLGLAIAAPVFALRLGGALWPLARGRRGSGLAAWWHYALGLSFASAQGFGLLVAALVTSAAAHPVWPRPATTTPLWMWPLRVLAPAATTPDSTPDVAVSFEVWAALRAAPDLVFALWRLALPVAFPVLVVAVTWQAAAAVAARVTAQGAIAPWAEAAVSLVVVLVLAAIAPTLWAYLAATLVTPLQ